MKKKKLRVTLHSPAYWRVTFDNPPLNLIDPEILHELQDLINQFEAANELKVVVFDSANPDYYIAHVDILRGGGRGPTDVGPTGLTFTRLYATFVPSSYYQHSLHTWQSKRYWCRNTPSHVTYHQALNHCSGLLIQQL